MKIEQTSWTELSGWEPAHPGQLKDASLVLVFSSTGLIRKTETIGNLRRAYPDAILFGCSTAGEIVDTRVRDDSISVTAVQFEGTTVRCEGIGSVGGSSFEAGQRLANELPHDDLVHALVLSDGLSVNGSELVKGISSCLPPHVSLTGGLSADGGRFGETRVVIGSTSKTDSVALLGLYGERLRVGYASLGGWDSFGPERLITRSEGNVLYELDGKPALELYKNYLGEHAAGLPATGLLFPLSLRTNGDETPVVRTILAIDESIPSMTFAGDVPEGSYARLMKANFERLIDGASDAAQNSCVSESSPDLALLVSCVGRKMVLKQRTEEEVEAVRDVLGPATVLTGFYSYGEISPFTPNARCELHNQTMTITTLSESKA